jgi:hypothetical protein
MAMTNCIYRFGDIMDDPNLGWVQFESQVQKLGVTSYVQGSARVAIRDNSFSKRTIAAIAPEVADCADVALAVHTADRLTMRTPAVLPHVHIVLPVRRPELWSQPMITEALQELLYWYTQEEWTFEFVERDGWPRLSELQTCLPTAGESVEVALWSGGLDAYAGFLNRMLSRDPHIRSAAESFVLFGTGSDPFIHGKQRALSKSVALLAPWRTKFVQVPIQVRNNDVHLDRDSSQRARGFVFLLLGAVCACLEGQDQLHVYENGIGALNLPFRQSEIGRDHTVSVHPLSLLRMSNLVSLVLNRPFQYHNPFVTMTKGQMCEILNDEAATYLQFVPNTVSCDGLLRERPRQCGVCSSCLLRRQSLAAARIIDQTKYHVLAHLDYVSTTDEQITKAHGSHYLLAMEHQVNLLAKLLASPYASEAWNALSDEYPVLQTVVDQTSAAAERADRITEAHLLQLYRRYVGEWNSVKLRQLLCTGLVSPPQRSGYEYGSTMSALYV